MKPMFEDGYWVGWMCYNGHHKRLTKWQMKNTSSVKSECQCPYCDDTMVPASGKINEKGELIPWEW